MIEDSITVLLIEDNPGDVRLVQALLAEASRTDIKLESVNSLSCAIEILSELDVDLILLDLGLPDSQGLYTFTQMKAHAPDIPIVILTGLNDEQLAMDRLKNTQFRRYGSGTFFANDIMFDGLSRQPPGHACRRVPWGLYYGQHVQADACAPLRRHS